MEVKSGRMQKFLQEVVDLCLAHVYSCGLCVLKGFICEICKDSKPIFPFETESTVKVHIKKYISNFGKNAKSMGLK